MKIQIRNGVFETNSSSVHTLTICEDAVFNRWKKGELYFDYYGECFITKEEALSKLSKGISGNRAVGAYLTKRRIYSYRAYFNICDLTPFMKSYTTTKGDKVIAFGTYGVWR